MVAESRADLSLKLELENAIGKGLAWLAGRQEPGGFWAQAEYPALTAFILTAFQGDPSGFYKRKFEQNIKAAMTTWSGASSLTAASMARTWPTTIPPSP